MAPKSNSPVSDIDHKAAQVAGRLAKLPECIRPHIDEGDPCWSFLPKGWHNLIERLHYNLIQVRPDYKIKQVKEKYGTLCFYTDVRYDENDIASIIINHYEGMSQRTCDVCGVCKHDVKITSIRNCGYIAARCPEHRSPDFNERW